MKLLKILGIILLLFIVVYFLGPQPSKPVYSKELPAVPSDPALLENYIQVNENLHKLKADNQARIIWADSSKTKTEYAVVYIHGFSASQEEGDPVHENFAKRYRLNLFLNRLEDHGIDTSEALLTVTADRLWSSAKEAYAIGKQLGNKVILLATSTGATLALKLAAEYPDVHSLLLLSPNIAINNPSAWLLNNHWGLQIARLVEGHYIKAKDTTAQYAKYWDNKYRTESAVQLQELLETTMKESTFKKISQPTLVLYYYKDEDHQDPVVKVSAMHRMFRQLSTPENLKRMVAIPDAGDHVIGSYIKSKAVPHVERECQKFADDILQLKAQR